MKKFIVYIVILGIAACTPKPGNKEIADLQSKRDSLQKLQSEITIELNKVEMEIAIADTSVNPNDLKLIKKITTQKDKIVAIDEKIKKLENKMTAKDQKKLLTVAVKEIKPELFNHYIIAFGEVKAKNYAMISPEMGGRIEKIHVSQGQQVLKGQLLVSINDDAIEKQIEGVKSGLELATKTYNKLDTLWKQNIGSEIEYLIAKNAKATLESQLETLQAQKRMTQIIAPFDGIVDKIFPKDGEIAGPGQPVIEFVNLSKLYIKANISETHIDKIKNGELVELSFSSLPDLIIKTPIVRMSKVIASASRTFEIEMIIDNPGEKIIPNMVSTIKINDFSTNDAFVVPSLAIRKDITGKYVYVVNSMENKNVVAKKYISPTLSYDDKTMVPDGLNLNDKVIVKGYHLVSAGVPVNLDK